jgi:hypothetical protein
VAFLAGAAGRLLPASIPFRYFGAAAVYHVAAWIALVAGARDAPHFAGGLGWPLAALHLCTLGVLVMTALGASVQLLPVATRQPVFSRAVPALAWWVYTPGVAAVAAGMGLAQPWLLAAGGAATLFALALFAVLLVRNLIGAKGMPCVVAHGWIAVTALGVLLVTALSLAGTYAGLPLLPRHPALGLHVAFAAYGFMGMLALGLAYVLVPMFALSPSPSERGGLVSAALAGAALLAAGAAAFGVQPRVLWLLAIALAAVACTLHVRLMHIALAAGMRRVLGRSFVLVRIGWGLLLASLAAALAVVLDLPVPNAATLFGVLLVPGWLLTFLLGILQRVVPFLASMHAARGKHLPPTPTSLTAARPLAVHFHAHLVALALLVAGVLAGSAWLVAAAALAGTAGAVAFAVSVLVPLRRMAQARATGQAHLIRVNGAGG